MATLLFVLTPLCCKRYMMTGLSITVHRLLIKHVYLLYNIKLRFKICSPFKGFANYSYKLATFSYGALLPPARKETKSNRGTLK